ncbi:MAG: hypothetical protein JWP34_4803, partial [Massilia sp.]|nr:hypothetical protein [Massilia sp.]
MDRRRLEHKGTATLGLERKDTMVSGAGPLLGLEAPQGIVTAIVSVTGVVDSDGDVIEPGAYGKTLQVRHPKVVWHHDWEQPIGRVLDIKELFPGDSQLPKATKDGKAWPSEAGALVATMQFNLQSTRGAQAFEDVRFYSESGEAEYSIGYRVAPSAARKDRSGVRHIKELELFELSPVLFGANGLSGTLAVKSSTAPVTDADDGWGDDGDDNQSADLLDGWEDAPNTEHVFQEPGPTLTDPDPDPLMCEACGMHLAHPIHESVPAGGYHEGKSGAPGVADTPQAARNTERLQSWYTHGDGAARIGWGRHGDFDACVKIASEHMTAEQAKGFCAERHHDATGGWPGPHAHDGKPGNKGFGGGDGPMSIHPAGSYEERADLIEAAVQELLVDDDDADPADDGKDDTPLNAGGAGSWMWAEVNGTWDDHVIATRYGVNQAVPSAPPRVESYEIPYTITGDGQVQLSDPRPVK